MFESSKDVLNLAIALAVVGFAGFACWATFYFAMILRQMFMVIREMRERIKRVDELINSIKEKIEHTTSYLLLISEGVKKLTEVAKEYLNKEK